MSKAQLLSNTVGASLVIPYAKGWLVSKFMRRIDPSQTNSSLFTALMTFLTGILKLSMARLHAELTNTKVPPSSTNDFKLRSPFCVIPPTYFGGIVPVRQPLMIAEDLRVSGIIITSQLLLRFPALISASNMLLQGNSYFSSTHLVQPSFALAIQDLYIPVLTFFRL